VRIVQKSYLSHCCTSHVRVVSNSMRRLLNSIDVDLEWRGTPFDTCHHSVFDHELVPAQRNNEVS
jgi:hypothetical protein